MRRSGPTNRELSRLLERWVARSIITADQAEQIRADAETAGYDDGGPPHPRPSSLVTEALGYVGGAIVLVALGLLTGTLWGDLSTGARLAIAGGVTAALLIAGAVVAGEPGGTASRLRTVLWLMGSAALATFLALVADAFAWYTEGGVVFAAGGTALASAVLWWVHPRALQHLAVLVPVLVAAAAAAQLLADPGYLAGLALWGVGLAWAALARGGVLPPLRVGVPAGAVGAVVGAASVTDTAWGSVLALVTVVALAVAAVATRDLLLLAVAVVGTLVVLGMVFDRLGAELWEGALALLVAGLMLVAAAVLTVHRR